MTDAEAHIYELLLAGYYSLPANILGHCKFVMDALEMLEDIGIHGRGKDCFYDYQMRGPETDRHEGG